MTYILSFDPGKQTGITLGEYSDTEPYRRLDYWQVGGGLAGFLAWQSEHAEITGTSETVSEKFTLRNNKFVADTTPLLIEGAMITLGMDCIWQQPALKATVPDKILKDNGLWLTGKMVGHKDARDANDSCIHALAYLRRKHHAPTLKAFWGDK